MPIPPQLGAFSHGDRDLAERVESALTDGPRDRVAVAERDADGTIVFAGFDADERTEFEIGSLTKTFTAALYRDAVDRGEVTTDTRLGELIEEIDGEAADITLDKLATHHSGLPRIGFDGLADRLSFLAVSATGGDPYDRDEDDLIDVLTAVEPDEEADPEYSNLGYSALGLALARATETPYRDLLQTRILDELGMETTRLVETDEDLGEGSPAGTSGQAYTAARWTMEADAAAGGIRSTIGDMSIWMNAVVEGTAPGSDAVRPVTTYTDGRRIGAAWITNPPAENTPEITWHNGGTGGFSSYIGFTDSGHAVVGLSNTDASLNSLSALLTDRRSEAGGAE